MSNDKEYLKQYYKKHSDKLKENSRVNRKKRVEYYREYDKQRNKTEKRKEQQRKSGRKAYIKHRGMVDALKSNGCSLCGYNICKASLDFHHVNSEIKKFRIIASYIYGKSNIELAYEICKCILVCKNCHGEIHDKERNWVQTT